MTHAEMRDALSEAARYVKRSPRAACLIVENVIIQIEKHYFKSKDPVERRLWGRLMDNLAAGVMASRCDPEVFINYCYCARHEVAGLS